MRRAILHLQSPYQALVSLSVLERSGVEEAIALLAPGRGSLRVLTEFCELLYEESDIPVELIPVAVKPLATRGSLAKVSAGQRMWNLIRRLPREATVLGTANPYTLLYAQLRSWVRTVDEAVYIEDGIGTYSMLSLDDLKSSAAQRAKLRLLHVESRSRLGSLDGVQIDTAYLSLPDAAPSVLAGCRLVSVDFRPAGASKRLAERLRSVVFRQASTLRAEGRTGIIVLPLSSSLTEIQVAYAQSLVSADPVRWDVKIHPRDELAAVGRLIPGASVVASDCPVELLAASDHYGEIVVGATTALFSSRLFGSAARVSAIPGVDAQIPRSVLQSIVRSPFEVQFPGSPRLRS